MKRSLLAIVPLALLVSCSPQSAQTISQLTDLAPLPSRVRVQAPQGMTVSEAHTIPYPSKLGQRGPAVAFGDGVYLLVWQEGFSGYGGKSQILGLRIDAKGESIDKEPVVIAGGHGQHESPSVAFAGGKFLVAWSWEMKPGQKVYFWQFFNPEPKGLKIGGTGGRDSANIAAASNGKDEFLLVWQEFAGDHYFLNGQRVSSEGMSLDKNLLSIAEHGEQPQVVWTGDGYVVGSRWNYTVLDTAGKTKVPTTQAWSKKWVGLGCGLAAAWGKAFLFFNCEPMPDPWGWSGGGAIIGVTINPDGASPEMKLAEPFGNAQAAEADGQIANCLDAARWRNHPGWPMGMRGALKGTHNDQWPSGTPTACYNGRSLLVVWPRGRWVDSRRLDNRDLYLARVLPDWGTVDRQPTCIVGGPTEETNPVLCAGPVGQALLAYEKVTDEGVRTEYRVLAEAEDKQPPKVEYVVPKSANELIVAFDEPVDAGSVKAESLSIEPTVPQSSSLMVAPAVVVKSAVLNPDARGQQREVILTIDKPLSAGSIYVLTTNGVKDRSPAGNAAAGQTFQFTAKPGQMLRGYFLEGWTVVGPFPRDTKNHPFDVTGVRPSPGDAAKTAGGEVKWKPATRQAIDLGSVFDEKNEQMCYANIYVFADQARDVVLRTDTNDHNRVWLNGKLVQDGITGATASRGFHDYTDETPISLKAGWNQLLIQVDNWVTTWMMSVQITDQNGVEIRDLTVQAEDPK